MDALDRTHGVRLRRSAAAALALSGILAGCGLVEPKQTYEQAYEAMRPDAMAAMKEAWPGVQMEKESADLEECGGLDISADKNASKIEQSATYRGEVPAEDKRSIEELVRAVGERLLERGWRSGGATRSPGGGDLEFARELPGKVLLDMEKPGVHGWVAVEAFVDPPQRHSVSINLVTECLRNPEWQK
ncbi:hypothetical protein ABZ663_07465 [Streptomyces albidoflavus]|uniref:hypothetical protein n=1 Tax=Streptomyces albidoflavus TaxID=1886 RepID=UPI0033D9F76D